jgi:hypothetical protein
VKGKTMAKAIPHSEFFTVEKTSSSKYYRVVHKPSDERFGYFKRQRDAIQCITDMVTVLPLEYWKHENVSAAMEGVLSLQECKEIACKLNQVKRRLESA